jgi:hypothetical protein
MGIDTGIERLPEGGADRLPDPCLHPSVSFLICLIICEMRKVEQMEQMKSKLFSSNTVRSLITAHTLCRFRAYIVS